MALCVANRTSPFIIPDDSEDTEPVIPSELNYFVCVCTSQYFDGDAFGLGKIF